MIKVIFLCFLFKYFIMIGVSCTFLVFFFFLRILYLYSWFQNKLMYILNIFIT